MSDRVEGWKVAVQQRVVPTYRATFFRRLAERVGGIDLFSGQPRDDEAISTIALDDGGITHRTGRNIHLGKGRLYLCWQTGLGSWLDEVQPDVLIAEANPRLISTWMLLLTPRRRRLRKIGWGLGVMRRADPKFPRLRNRIQGFFFRRFDALIGYSSKAVADYVALGAPRDSVHLAVNAATDAPSSEGSPAPDPELSSILESISSGGQPVLMFVGRLLPSKRVDVLIDAWRNLAIPSSLVIVGDGSHRAELEKQARAAKREDVFFLGERRDKDLGAIFGVADLVVMPGSGGLAIQEAFRYGVPVVAGRKGDGSEEDLIIDGETGYLLDESSVGALDRLLTSLLPDRTSLQKMGARARAVVVQKANVTEMADSFARAINSVLG